MFFCVDDDRISFTYIEASSSNSDCMETAFSTLTTTRCVSDDYLLGTQILTRRLVAMQISMSTVLAAGPAAAALVT